MPNTEHIHLPLYTDEETPDISTTGHYNHAMGILDAEAGELEAADADLAAKLAKETQDRKGADTAIKADLDAETARATAAEGKNADAIAAEVTARKAADTALGKRIDNAEVEISANSADLTGIKGLTYGADHVTFLENENGAYTSPALEEVAEQIEKLESNGWYVINNYNSETPQQLSPEQLAIVQKNPYRVALVIGNSSVALPMSIPPYSKSYRYVYFYDASTGFTARIVSVSPEGAVTESTVTDPSWFRIANAPFYYLGKGVTTAEGESKHIELTLSAASSDTIGGVKIGSGLSVTSDGTLSVDTSGETGSALTVLDLTCAQGATITLDDETVSKIKSNYPAVVINWRRKAGAPANVAMPIVSSSSDTSTQYTWMTQNNSSIVHMNVFTASKEFSVQEITTHYYSQWNLIDNRPFYNLGYGLRVTTANDKQLYVDTSALFAITWGDIES